MPRSVAPRAAAFLVAAGICAVPAGALPDEKDEWIRVRTANFTLFSNAGERRVEKIGRKLEQLREVLAETSSGMTLQSPLPTYIYVFKNRRAFEPFVIGEDGKPASQAGYFTRALDANFVAIDASADRLPFPVIYHEFLHYVLENNVPAIPLWLNEGLAEFYSSFAIFGGKAEIGRAVPQHLLRLVSQPLMPLDDLFATDTSSPEYHESESVGMFYAQSWALTHYLLVDAARRERMGGFLRLLSQGVDSVKAFERAYEMDLATTEKALREHILSGSDTFYRYTPQEAFEKHVAEVAPMERKELLYRLGDLLAHHSPVQFDAAEEHLRAATALDETFADAWVTLALLRLIQERPAEAVELCRAATTLDPQSARARALYGTSLISQFAATVDVEADLPDAPPPLLLQAREQFRQALELGPDQLDSSIGLGRTYLFSREDPGEGIDALARVMHDRPARIDVLSDLIVLTARSGNVAGARSLLDRALRPRGDAELTQATESRVVQIEMESVEMLVGEGNLDAAIEAAQSCADATQDPGLKQAVLSAIVELTTAREQERYSELREEAVAAGAAGDPDRARELLEQLGEAVEQSRGAEGAVDLYNQAIQLANQGDLVNAAEMLERVIALTDRPDLERSARNHAAEMRRILRHNAHVDRLNEAVDRINAGDPKTAAALLEALLEDEPAAELRGRAEQILRAARRELGD